MLKGWIAFICALVLTAAGAVPAQQAPDLRSYLDGLDWVVIGDIRNPGFPGYGPWGQLKGRGAIDYHYRLTRTEVTVAQWFEFVQAYAPYYEGSYGQSIGLTGSFIYIDGPLNDPDSYHIVKGTENFPANQSWRMAARYCNWLHNGKENTEEAFSQGAYDTSTFTENEDGSYNDQATRSPGAKYWIPSLDEWIKGVYYDPASNGGEGGWWWYPNSSDEELIAGLPWEGGETNTTLFWYIPDTPLEVLEVGAYPFTQSPWGLLDGSGGMREWTEEFGNSIHTRRRTKGSSFFSGDLWEIEDFIVESRPASANTTTMEGFRLASRVPAFPTVDSGPRDSDN